VSEWLANGLILLGLAVMTLGVYGVVWLPDVYTKLHASSKAAFLGVSGLLVAAALGGDPAIVARVVLILAVLGLTTPVSAHVIGQAAYFRREPMRTPGAVDETHSTPGARDTPAARPGDEPVPDA
jgi:multicomponent Na+:H+ antiporter subunit G